MIPIARPLIGDEEKKAVLEVLSSGYLAQGDKVKRFEKEFAKYIGVEHCIAVNSGTAALHLALLALGVKDDDEVITSAFSFASSANSILFCGATPVFSDVNPKTFNIDPMEIKKKITKKTKCIIPVHLYGQPAEMDIIKEIADENNLLIVEDAAQAHGAEYKNIRAGALGDVGCFSFYPTKNITTGEGGIITTNDGGVAEKIKLLRNHGQSKQYYHSILGFNFRMTEFVAAIGIEQLKKLDKLNDKRIQNANFLKENMLNVKGVVLPFVFPDVKHVFHQFTIRVVSDKLSRDGLANNLEKNGIGTRVYYPVPIHKQLLYKDLGYTDSLPESESASKEVLSIPVHPSLTEEELSFIVEKIKSNLS